MEKQEIGIIGLGVMGRSLALNMEGNGFRIAGFDLDIKKTKKAQEDFSGKNIVLTSSIKELIDALESPKKILIMVPAGAAVDSVIRDALPYLSKKDILIDGGNSFFKHTARRLKEVTEKGLLYIGTGVSGGEEGALKGPSIMPGGHKEAYDALAPILTKIAAQVGGDPCCDYMGPGGAGHYVKMVHNGIEYAIMQTIVESYDLMKDVLKLSAKEQASLFTEWNHGVLGSYLIEITGRILAKKDEESNKSLVDLILDEASHKGTGKWTSQSAMDLGVPIPSIDAALQARFISAYKSERVKTSKILTGPSIEFAGNKDKFIEKIRDALYASEILAYVQGLSLLRAASKRYNFDLNLGNIAKIWRGGCIIRSKVLEKITTAYENNPELPNLLFDDYFSGLLNEMQDSLRSVVQTANKCGIPCLVTSSSLGYYDSYRKERLPANLIQGQRDYFGAHTYKRIDKEGVFHTQW